MEQTAVSLQSLQKLGVMSGREAMSLAGMTGLSAGDPFLAIIQNMIDQMMEGQSANGATLTPQAQPQNGQNNDSEQQALLQSFAAMLMHDPTLAAQLLADHSTQEQPQQAAAVTQAVTDADNPIAAVPLTAQQALTQSELPAAAQIAQPFTLQSAQQASEQTAAQSANTQHADLPPQFSGFITQLRYTETVTQPDAPQNQDALLGQHQFQNAVSQAKRKLQPQEAVNLEELPPTQPRPISQEPIAVRKAESPVQEAKVLDQLKTGITENLAKGSSEFTMKLKPEALGEITVKLIRTADKTTLSITAASSQTTKLINNELEALREAVRPMQVEVREAVHQTSQPSGQMQQQFSQTSQQFSDHRRAFAWQNSQSQNRGILPEEEDFLAQVMAQPTVPGALNIYV